VLTAPDIPKPIYRPNDIFGVNKPYLTDQISCASDARPELPVMGGTAGEASKDSE